MIDMINEFKSDISHFEDKIEFHMDLMRKNTYAQNKDALDENFKFVMHFMVRLWAAENDLVNAQKELEAKTKSGAVYGKAALEGEKDEMDNNDGCNDSDKRT